MVCVGIGIKIDLHFNEIGNEMTSVLLTQVLFMYFSIRLNDNRNLLDHFMRNFVFRKEGTPFSQGLLM